MSNIKTSTKITLIALGILLVLSLLVGASYAYYIVNVSQTNKNVVKSSCLNLSISNEENVIKLEKQIPIMNEEGKNLTPYTFTINNTCNSMIGYSLNLEELEGSTLASKYIMTMVNDKTYVNMASLSSTDNYYDSSVESRVLATGSLGPNASINYSLRLWMDEATPMTTDAMNKSFRSKVVVVATPTQTIDFDYTGTEQVFTAPVSGTYKLETWGAQGGSYEDTYNVGGYSVGVVALKDGDSLFINVGGAGNTSSLEKSSGGYNGGGISYGQYGHENIRFFSSGGGATHIATKSGLLSKLENFKENVFIVSGGGGGSFYDASKLVPGGYGGGYVGGDGAQDNQGWGTYGSGGTQSAGGYSYCDDSSCSGWGTIYPTITYLKKGMFGKGADSSEGTPSTGGGGGWYGGGGAIHVQSSGGGSGYIGNSLLTNKAMYCYNCEESLEESTKTISTTCAKETPTANCAKKGNGYARITYIG